MNATSFLRTIHSTHLSLIYVNVRLMKKSGLARQKQVVLAGLSALNLIFYIALFTWVPSRHVSGRVLMWSLLLGMGLMVIGFVHGKNLGCRVAKYGAWLLILTELVLLTMIVVSAAYLHGTYGAFGRGASVVALLVAFLSIQLVGLFPMITLRVLKNN